MAIGKIVTLNWNEVEYRVKITMRVIDRIEEEVNLIKMLQQVRANDARASQIARLLAILLCEAGAEVTPDDVFGALFGAGEFDPEDVQVMMMAIFSAIFPEPKKSVTTPSVKSKKNTTKRSARKKVKG